MLNSLMQLKDIGNDWTNTRPGVWHRPYRVKRGEFYTVEPKIYYEAVCQGCGGKFVDPRKWAKYCRWNCANKAIRKFGDLHRRWNGGRAHIGTGYVLVLVSRQPRRYVFEHRLVMEKILGRKLQLTEVVHHKNGVRSDNRPENLEVMTRAAHCLLHRPRGNRLS